MKKSGILLRVTVRGSAVDWNSLDGNGGVRINGKAPSGTITVEMNGIKMEVDAEMYYRNIGTEILAQQSGVTYQDYNTTTKQEWLAVGNGAALIFGGLGYATGSVVATSVGWGIGGTTLLADDNFNEGGAVSLGVDMLNYKFGKYLGPTLSESINAYNMLFQISGATSGVQPACQVPMKCN